jgi:hypothetical protein
MDCLDGGFTHEQYVNFSTICCTKPGLQAQEDENEGKRYRKDKP